MELIVVGVNQYTFGGISGKWSFAILNFKSFNATMSSIRTFLDTNISSLVND
jgi:hypothetical protein